MVYEMATGQKPFRSADDIGLEEVDISGSLGFSWEAHHFAKACLQFDQC